ncbi:MAG: MFS transporter [Lachnospiraceae bacterium]|nr:MFS transporter [Lachnospiraceae bacterium]
MDKKFIKKYGTLLLLAAGSGFIFQLPYIRETFYVPIQKAMGLTNSQMGMLNAWYAIVATPAYFLGGIVADKFSPKLMLTFSFISTGLLGLWFSTFPGFMASRIIFGAMGFTTVMTFWSSVIKATRMLGDSSEQGRLFGLQEGLRGILNALLVFVMTGIYAKFADKVAGASWSIRFCAILLLVVGVLCWFVIDNTNENAESETLGQVIGGMMKCLVIPRVWILVGIVFTAYSIYGIMGYVTTYAINLYGLSEEAGATVGGIRYLLQGVGGIIGGFLADKIHSRLKVIMGAGGLLAVNWMLFFIIPAEVSALPLVLGNFMFGLILVYAIRSQYFADIDDAGLDVNITGRVSGIVSTFGYLPDVFMFTMIGGWIDSYGRNGYNMMFAYAAAMGVGCLLLAFLLHVIIKKDKKTA